MKLQVTNLDEDKTLVVINLVHTSLKKQWSVVQSQ